MVLIGTRWTIHTIHLITKVADWDFSMKTKFEQIKMAFVVFAYNIGTIIIIIICR